MVDDVLRLRALAERRNALPCREDEEFVMPFTDEHHRARHRWLAWQSVEYAVVGNEAIPADAALLGAEAIPHVFFGQKSQLLFDPEIHRNLARGAMHPLVEPITP